MIAPTSAAHENGTIKQFGEWLAKNWYTPGNPAKNLETNTPKRSAGKAISYEQEAELLADTFTAATRTKLLLALDAGLRAGEVLAARRQDWNREEKTLHVWSTKTRTARTAPLTTRLTTQLEEIAAHLLPEQTIVKSSLKPTAGTSFLRKRRQRGKETPRFHDLRHTFASRLAAVAPPHHVRELLGHAPRTTTDLYMHPQPEELRNSINLMEAANPNANTIPKAAAQPQPSQPTKEEKQMPGKRYTLKLNNLKYGIYDGARCRPAENQNGTHPGEIIVEVQGEEGTKLIAALADLQQIEQPNPHAKESQQKPIEPETQKQ